MLKRYTMFLLLAALALLSPHIEKTAASSQSKPKPNVLFIAVDDDRMRK